MGFIYHEYSNKTYRMIAIPMTKKQFRMGFIYHEYSNKTYRMVAILMTKKQFKFAL